MAFGGKDFAILPGIFSGVVYIHLRAFRCYTPINNDLSFYDLSF